MEELLGRVDEGVRDIVGVDGGVHLLCGPQQSVKALTIELSSQVLAEYHVAP